MNKKVLSLFITAVFTISLFAAWPSKSSAAAAGSTAGTVAITSGVLNVRSGSSSGTTVVAQLARNSHVSLLSKSGSWWKVEYAAGKIGYCSGSYIKPVSGSYAAYVKISSGSLNIRKGAGTSYAIKGRLPNGKGVVVLSQQNGWSRILYNGIQLGFVSSAYLRAFGSTSPAPSSLSYPAIKLSVPSYKQTDSRWGNVKIGTTGKTIASAGCLTTVLAMSESYRTKTTVYPNTMASRLTYTAGGAAYWPSNYSFSFNAAYLNTLYAQLKAGKAVLFGAKNSYGSQHWVVITGYTGGNTLAASGFTMNDPGSTSRTTLRHLLNSYPIFYKAAY
ncbi:MAG: SH3 domain-containing protein [Oscillospiraceae bacterium]|nr:SH3 domain-containing protein [Oscillospiraceae bacterium]MDD4414469.1 SH3 domain-containing protein [Oscillospiraceae bacterium]